tara:strand:- start:300 stop:1187 length:888 start_codon:yes stop_codon:yes gene_type:complete
MELFKTSSDVVTLDQLSEAFSKLDLKGKDVLIYSRLLSFGRVKSLDAIEVFIETLIDNIGPEGTLIIPTYTLNCYEERIFDLNKSKIMSGILGEIASRDEKFIRTIHPVYSNVIIGYNKDIFYRQNASTCFGDGSFFDIFSKNKNGVVLMAGLNFNGPTLYHYYDQKFEASGRFIKQFNINMVLGDHVFDMTFDSFVKDRDFYFEKMNCLARFDALAKELNLVQSVQLGDDFIHMITEKNFQELYRVVLEVDQNYFLLSSEDLWDTYYLKNEFGCLHGKIDKSKVDLVRSKINLF